jgi:choline/glycine/proline betaine transport protein
MCYSLYIGVRDEYLKSEEKKVQKEMESYEEVISDLIKKRGSNTKEKH